eukprot:3909873-Ditylum_brightwellii.AAC.1
MGLAEVNINWSQLHEDDRPPSRYHVHFDAGTIAATHSHNIRDKISGKYQRRGTSSITLGNFTGRIDGKESGHDPTGLGRFSWHLLQSKGGVTLRVITVYRP